MSLITKETPCWTYWNDPMKDDAIIIAFLGQLCKVLARLQFLKVWSIRRRFYAHLGRDPSTIQP